MSSTRDPRYKTARWHRAARAAIVAAGGQCEMRLDGCTGAATECNHRVSPLLATTPAENHRLFWSPLNHEAACKHCNASDGARLGHELKKRRRYTPSRKW